MKILKYLLLLIIVVTVYSCKTEDISGLYVREGSIGGALLISKVDGGFLVTPFRESNGKITTPMSKGTVIKYSKLGVYNFQITFQDVKPFTIVFDMKLKDNRLVGYEFYKDNPDKNRNTAYQRVSP